MFLCPVLGLASRNVNQERRFSFGVESSTRTEPLTPRNKVIQRIEYSNFLFSWPSRQMYKGNQIKIRIFLCECGAGGARGFGGLEIPKSRNRGCPTPPSVPSGCRLQGVAGPQPCQQGLLSLTFLAQSHQLANPPSDHHVSSIFFCNHFCSCLTCFL